MLEKVLIDAKPILILGSLRSERYWVTTIIRAPQARIQKYSRHPLSNFLFLVLYVWRA
ncbi:hypothetical protein BDV12DRAFT_166323 [Aspergillus spectabilis]